MRGCCTATMSVPRPAIAKPTAAPVPPQAITIPGQGGTNWPGGNAANGRGQSLAVTNFHGARAAISRMSGASPAASAKPNPCACNPA